MCNRGNAARAYHRNLRTVHHTVKESRLGSCRRELRVPELQFFIGLVQVSPLYSYVDTAGDFARELFK